MTEFKRLRNPNEEYIPLRRKKSCKPTGKQLAEMAKPYQWKKGVTGNPGGRPKHATQLTRLLADQMHEKASCIPDVKEKALKLGLDPDQSSIATVLTASLLREAIEKPGSRVSEMVYDRLEGKVKQTLETMSEVNTVVRSSSTHRLDLSKLSDEELEELDGTLEKLNKCLPE